MKRFKKIYLEITNACNLRCTICPGTDRPIDFLSPDRFEAVLKEIKPFTDYLYLHVMGEPLVHPHFSTLLMLCRRYDMKVNLTTNGVFIKKHQEVLLNAPALRQFNFSIHCADLQPGNGLSHTYLDEILDFVEEGRKKTNLYFSLRLWNTSKDKLYESPLAQKIAGFFGAVLSPSDPLLTGRDITLAGTVFLAAAESFVWPTVDTGDQSAVCAMGSCLGLRDHCGILVDGTVVPCCLDKDGIISLGNVFQSPFSDIVNSDRVLAMATGFKNGKIIEPLCRVCEFRRRFSKKSDGN